MKLLIRSVTLVDPSSAKNGQVQDVLIEKGRISQIGKLKDVSADTIWEAAGACLSPGWMDMNVNFCDPGFENKEDLQSGMNAAAAGGFTAVALMPNTQPVIQSKTGVEYIRQKAQGHAVNVHPIAALSLEREGKDMAELYDMQQSGAIAFSDGSRPIADAGFLSRALLYAKGIGAKIIQYADEASISGKGKMNEGPTSTILGVKGIPALAEELMIARDIYLAAYNDAEIHFTTVSTAGSVALIRDAKKKGIKVTADVSAHHLVLDETALEGFDSLYKVKPPLRTKEDIKALKQGLKDGTIDAICSQHAPEDIEHKQVELEIAAYGMIGLQTAFSLANAAVGKELGVAGLVEKLAINPRRILGLPVPEIKEGAEANLTFFHPEQSWIFEENSIRSKSKNSPFIGQQLKGKALGIINKGKIIQA